MKKLFDLTQAKRFWGHIKNLFLPKPKNEGTFGKYLKYISEDITEWADFPSALIFKGIVDTYDDLLTIADAKRGDLYHIEKGDQAGSEYFYNGESWEYVGQLIKIDEAAYVKKIGDTMTGALNFTQKAVNGDNTIIIDGKNKSITLRTDNTKSAKIIELNGSNSIINGDGLSEVEYGTKNAVVIGYSILYNDVSIDNIVTGSDGRKTITIDLINDNSTYQALFREIDFLTDWGATGVLKFRIADYDNPNSEIFQASVTLKVQDFEWVITGDSGKYVVKDTFSPFDLIKDYVYSTYHAENLPNLTFRLTLQELTSGNWDSSLANGDSIDLIYSNTLNGTLGENGSVILGKSNNIIDAHHAFAQGFGNIVISDQGNASGKLNLIDSNAQNAHVEGYYNVASDKQAHAEGARTKASAENAHAEGEWTAARGKDSHAEGYGALTGEKAAHAEGYGTAATGYGSHAEGCQNDDGNSSDSLNNDETFKENIQIKNKVAQYQYESGYYRALSGARGKASHVEGIGCSTGLLEQSTDGSYKLTKGFEGKAAHAQGKNCEAYGNYSFAGGQDSKSYGAKSLAFGAGCETGTAISGSTANNSVALGDHTVTLTNGELACGVYNTSATGRFLFSVGNGTIGNRSNAFEVNTMGTATVARDPVKNMDVATKQYVDAVKDYAISLNGQAAEITKKNTIIDEQHNSIEFYSGYNSTLLENFTAANISQIAKGATKITGTNWWGFSRPDPVGTTLYYPLIYFDKVSVKLIFNITITKTTTNKSATYSVCILVDTPPTHTAVILSELPKGLDFTLSKKPDDPSSTVKDTTQLLSLKVSSSFLSGCDVKIQLKQYSFVEGNKLGLKMVTKFEVSNNIPSYSNMTTNKNWIDYMEETAQVQAKSHPSIIGTEVPWQSLEKAVAQSATNQIQGAKKGNITLKYSPDILLNIDNITFEVGDHIPDTPYLYYTFKNFTNKLALS